MAIVANTNEIDILTDVKTTLEGITVANGYTSEVDAVEYHYRTWTTAGRAGSVIIGILPNSTDFEPITHNELRCTLNFQLVCHVQPTSDADRWTDIQALLDDCIQAMYEDPTRGGNAIDTNVRRKVSDMGDPDTYSHTGGTGTLVIDFQCRYHRLAYEEYVAPPPV